MKKIEEELNELKPQEDLTEYYILEDSKPATKEWTEELIEYED